MRAKTAVGIVGLVLSLCCATPSPAQDASAERAYRVYCADCHGVNGEGARGPSLKRPRIPRAPDAASLKLLIAAGIPNTSMPPTRVFGQDLDALAAYVLALGRQPREPLPGDPDRGAVLFRGKGGCTGCHIVNGEGGRMGPELTLIGRMRGAAHLRESLLKPEAELPERFAQYRIVIPMPDNFVVLRLHTRDGRQVRGIRLNEDPFTVQIRDFQDRVHSFQKQELARVERESGQSPMPAYGEKLGKAEIDDLVAYMLTLRGEE